MAIYIYRSGGGSPNPGPQNPLIRFLISAAVLICVIGVGILLLPVFGVIALVILMPLSSRRDPVGEHISAKVRPLVEVLVSLLLIVLLVLTLVYFLPQFPQYATAPYAYFVI